MGAWGYGYFEDDAALDFMSYVEDSDDPKEIINNALINAINAEELDPDGGNAIVVAATYIDSQVNGTKFSLPNELDPIEVDTFPSRYPNADLSGLKPLAVQALEKLLTECSELNGLWAENEEDYPAWRQGIEQLIKKLSD